MNTIERDIISKINEVTDLFSDTSKIKLVHLQSTEEPLSYFFILLSGFDLEKRQSFLGCKSFIEIMQSIIEKKYDDSRVIELEYQGTLEILDDYKPSGMRLLEKILLNPYIEGEEDDTRSIYAHKDYNTNIFYDWLGEVVAEDGINIVPVDDMSFTSKKSLESILEINGFQKETISKIHIVRCVRHPIGDYIFYVDS